MSSTRKTPDNSPLSQERYMSSPEYVELRGISGTAVAPRVAVLEDSEIRALIWFLQARSLEPGGLKQIAREILERYADRIGTPSMHKFGIKMGRSYTAAQVREIRTELPGRHEQDYPLTRERWSYDAGGYVDISQFGDEVNQTAIDQAKEHPNAYPVEKLLEACQHDSSAIVEFIIDVCINPRLRFRSRDNEQSDSEYKRRLEESFPDQNLRVEWAELYWFRDIVGALLDYKRRQEESVKADFVLTKIGGQVWETLDFSLRTGKMSAVLGLEGRGKSEAVRCWCQAHRGQARYIDLTGVTSKTTVFRAIAKALGIASSYSRTATEMQARVEDVLHRSRLMLAFDEAHFLFNQSARIYSRPELIDWIDTALCNHDVPVALITTPQFIDRVKQAEDQVGWNWRQFRRRVRRWKKLDAWNTDADLEAVARKLLPGITPSGLKLAVGYAKVSLNESPSRDVSGLADLALEAKLIAEDAGRSKITYEDLERAMTDHLTPSDTAFAEGMALASRKLGKGARRKNLKAVNHSLTDGLDSALEAENEDDAAEICRGRKTDTVASLSEARPRRSLVAA